jgi:hypothetical protein
MPTTSIKSTCIFIHFVYKYGTYIREKITYLLNHQITNLLNKHIKVLK